MKNRLSNLMGVFVCVLTAALAASHAAMAAPCVVPDTGGTVTLPPAGCDYLSPTAVHQIINGLPAGTTIQLTGIHRDFVCRGAQGTTPAACDFTPSPGCTTPGGSLGGEKECADSNLALTLHGTGVLSGYNRNLNLPVSFLTHVGPRTPGAPTQDFSTDMFKLGGQLPAGDPDFDLLRITAGTGFGMPSPGHTTLTQLPGGNWNVDSFFDITYRIDFIGHPGGPLGGMSGSTTATIRMATGSACVPANCDDGNACTIDACDQATGTCSHVAVSCDDNQICTDDFCDPASGTCSHSPANCNDGNPCTIDGCIQALLAPQCTVPDNGGGTVTLPPAGCDYLSPTDVHQIISGLPAGTTIQLGAIHKDFICGQGSAGAGVCSFPTVPGVDCDEAGGSLGGDKECSDSKLSMSLHGTGTLAGWDRSISLPMSFETHTGPRTPGQPVQSFDTSMFRMFGQMTGDPDFDLLRIVAGTDFGLPSPGHTTLTQLPGGNWKVDSFFDITYRIDFVGHPGGHIGGMSGSTTGTIRMQTGSGVGCVHTPVACDDGNPCTDDACDPVAGCVFTNDNTNSCSDGNACTNDVCVNGVCTCPTVNGACSGNTATFASQDVPKTIPTTAPPNVVTSTLTVSGVGPYLYDINLKTFITHTSTGQLQITLKSPAGTIVTISSQNGGTLDNLFNGTTWDDSADPGNPAPFTANTFAASNLVTDTVYTNLTTKTPLVPEEALGAFIGENPNGVWTLTIADTTNLDGGSLANWSVDVTTLPAPPIATTVTYTSADVPKTIPTTAPPIVVTSTVTVSGAGTQVGRLRLFAAISHTFPGDIDMTLTSPSGKSVTITSDNASAFVTNVYNGTLWDTKADPGNQVPYTVPLAASFMVTDTAYVTNVVKTTLTPEESLDAFIGVNPNGVWTLTISDDASGDGGTLSNWNLQITTTTCSTTLCAVDCNDNNPCTDDSCDPAVGCVHTNNASACNDGNACTSNDHCSNGACGGTATNCDDGNVCTDDACIPATGACSHTNNTNACDDGNACTTGDACGVSSAISFAQNFDGVAAPALPAGWVSTQSPAAATPWVTTAAFSVSPPNSANADTPTTVSDKTLDSPTFLAPAGGLLEFDNRYNLEFSTTTPGLGFDGAVLEIKIGAGAFTDIVTAGGSFVTGGYTHTISPGFSSPILNRPAWSAASAGFVHTKVNLPAASAGQPVVLRWRVASDSSAAATAPNGEWIDNIQVTSTAATCQPGAPTTCDDGNACTDDTCAQGLALSPACTVPDNGGGTVTLPPAGCDYLSPSDVHEIINGLPPGTTIELGAIHKDFICHSQPGTPTNCSFTPPPGTCEQPGGSLGGNEECSDSSLSLTLHGTGTLAGWDRTIAVPIQFETHVGPRTPGAPVQSFDTEMFRLQGQITGDPDFDLLRITGGNDFGLPSPGHTTLRQQPGGTWHVDSFFDITYRIDFVGHAGGHVGGMSGSTTGTIRMATGSGDPCVHTPHNCDDANPCTLDSCDPVSGCIHAPVSCDDNQICTNDSCSPATGQCVHTPVSCDDGNACTADACIQALVAPSCIVPDNGAGTVTLPPAGCNYLSPQDVHEIINGLPAGTTIELGPNHRDFVCRVPQGPGSVCDFTPTAGSCDQPGGSLGGRRECADSSLALALHGTGVLTGWDRTIQIPVSFETYVGPRTPGAPIQSFDTQMFKLQGQLPAGDPDFDLLRITAGNGFGLPSPGHTTLTRQAPGGPWAVDSFFDITYRIDFVGHPGGHIGGMSGSTTATIRMQTGSGVGCVHSAIVCNDSNVCTDDGCDPASGCFTTNNTAACNDGNNCTINDACANGACGGTVITAPNETANVLAPNKTTFTWTAQPLATQYDVVRGDAALFPVGPGGGDETCFDNLGAATVNDPAIPSPGKGFWYLSRGENTCGNGTFGNQGFHGAPGAPRVTTTCP